MLGAWPAASHGDGAAVARVAATCGDYPNQAAQRAADTADPDRDGIYCESLPCPCSKPGRGAPDGAAMGRPVADVTRRVVGARSACSASCSARRSTRTSAVTSVLRCVAAGRCGSQSTGRAPRTGATACEGIPTRAGFDRDEYPPAVGRGKGPRLESGRNPRGWKADVRYVRSSENRSHGASLGAQLEPYCDGTRFRYVFR
jgi:hypothetical protein